MKTERRSYRLIKLATDGRHEPNLQPGPGCSVPTVAAPSANVSPDLEEQGGRQSGKKGRKKPPLWTTGSN